MTRFPSDFIHKCILGVSVYVNVLVIVPILSHFIDPQQPKDSIHGFSHNMLQNRFHKVLLMVVPCRISRIKHRGRFVSVAHYNSSHKAGTWVLHLLVLIFMRRRVCVLCLLRFLVEVFFKICRLIYWEICIWDVCAKFLVSSTLKLRSLNLIKNIYSILFGVARCIRV